MALDNELCQNGGRELQKLGPGGDGLPSVVGAGLPLVITRMLQRSSLMLLLLLGVGAGLTLQGCGAYCEPQHPIVPYDALPDLPQMDISAGCKNVWNWKWGNPCASSVPVVWAKKGYYPSDFPQVILDVENENYECLDSTPGYCAMWTAKEVTCAEEDFGVCKCLSGDENSKYCKKWTCIAKEADQNLCWVGCCGKECSPCIVCGDHGSNPYPMNLASFNELMNLGGNSEIWALGEADMKNNLRESHWKEFNTPHGCIVSRDIHSAQETSCSTWREVETELSYCQCQRPNDSGDYCQDWKCEEQDIGQFAILFAKKISYEDLITGAEEEHYECASATTTEMGSKCNKWKGTIKSWEEVEITHCEGCSDAAAPHCKAWACDEYEMVKLKDYETTFGARFGFAILHLIWMLPIITCPITTLGAIRSDVDKVDTWTAFFPVIPEAIVAFFTCSLLWMLGFLRHHAQENFWRAPGTPFWGLLLTLLIPGVLSVLGSALTRRHIISPLLTIPVFLIVGFTWSCGLIVGGPLALLLVVFVGFTISNLPKYQCAGHQVSESESEESDASELLRES